MVGGLDHVLFFHTLGIIIATDSTDELIFFRGVDIPPTRYFKYWTTIGIQPLTLW